jgi:hypothetical protein
MPSPGERKAPKQLDADAPAAEALGRRELRELARRRHRPERVG